MTRIWKWVAVLSLLMLIFGAALIGVGYFSGSSIQRLVQTTDIADMTKFAAREQIEYWVYTAFDFLGKLFGG